MNRTVQKKIVELGCGKRKEIKEAIGIDKILSVHPNIVADLEKYPWPLKDNKFDLIICNHIIEHIEDITKFMDEIYRIAKPGAILKGRTPHFTSPRSFDDPTHKHHFTLRTLNFFCDNKEKQTFIVKFFNKILGCDRELPSHYIYRKFEKINISLEFRKIFRILGIKYFANTFKDMYEYYFCGIFRARDIVFQLKVNK